MAEQAFTPSIDELQGLHVGSVTRLIRMVDPQPETLKRPSHPVRVGVNDDGDSVWRLECQPVIRNKFGGKNITVSSPFICPFGAAGNQLWLREVWGVATRPCPNLGWYDGIEHAAEQAALEEHDMLRCYHVEIPDDVDLDELKGQWNSAESMPRWASSLVLDVTEVRVVRVNEVTDEDALCAGVCGFCDSDGILHQQTETDPAEMCGGRGGLGCIEEGHAKGLLHHLFPRAVFDANSWLWLGTVAKIEGTEQ